jgi:CCR4-NOT transcription complex subunit 4
MSIIENFNSNLQFFPSNTSSQNKNFFSSNSSEISNLENSRIIQKNLVYIIGLSLNLIKKDSLLKNYEFFGQYGKITKFVINKNKTYNSNNPNGPSYSCYVTYSNDSESSLAILALDNTIIDNHIIKASYGTTKYCLNFLKNSKCLNKDCLFLHKFANDEDIISKDELNNNKNLFSNQHVLAIKLSKIFTKEKRALIEKNKHLRTYFPNSYVVYSKDIVLCYLQTNLNYMNFQNFIFNNQNKFDFDYNKNSNSNIYGRVINNLNENNNNNNNSLNIINNNQLNNEFYSEENNQNNNSINNNDTNNNNNKEENSSEEEY